MNVPPSVCTAFETYRQKFEANPKISPDRAEASVEKSLECGCGYCSLACTALGHGDRLARNRERNGNALENNSRLNFVGDVKGEVKDETVMAMFKKSGMRFQGNGETREWFVLDRKH